LKWWMLLFGRHRNVEISGLSSRSGEGNKGLGSEARTGVGGDGAVADVDKLKDLTMRVFGTEGLTEETAGVYVAVLMGPKNPQNLRSQRTSQFYGFGVKARQNLTMRGLMVGAESSFGLSLRHLSFTPGMQQP
jgi:hypothetical protein